MTFYYDLDSFVKTSDPGLLDRIPHRLARYYLAFPLAEEDGRVTVVTAHPENKAALWVLRRLLNADIVPVSSSESAVREAIARIYSVDQPDTQTIVAWAENQSQAKMVHEVAEMFGQVLKQPVTFIDGGLPLGEHLRLGEGEECSLLVAGAMTGKVRYWMLRGSSASLVLVRGEAQPIKKILVVLRGYGSDYQTISRALPFLAHAGAEATILPLMNLSRWNSDNPLAGYAPARIHLETCMSGLTRADVEVSLRLRQGNPVDQIIAELNHSHYDLVVIAAEARGDFILNVLSRIDASGALPTQPILIVKPPVDPTLASV